MAGETIKEGDFVRLRSGGPRMTVGKISKGQAECFWADNVSNVFSKEIWLVALVKAVAKPPRIPRSF